MRGKRDPLKLQFGSAGNWRLEFVVFGLCFSMLFGFAGNFKVEAAESTGWTLAFSDDFSRAELGKNWKVFYGDWRIENGQLSGGGDLMIDKRFPGQQRLEFEAMSNDPCDLSPYIKATPWGEATGYLLQFGGSRNTVNNFFRFWEIKSKNNDYLITAGKVHKLVAEFDGRFVRLTVDGKVIHEYEEKEPLENSFWPLIKGGSHDIVGFYVYTSGTIDNVKVYTRPTAISARKGNPADEQKIMATFQNFPQDRWRGLDTFFPFGAYGVGFMRGDFESWGGDYLGAYGLYARHRFNFIAANDEVELGRYGGRAELKTYIAEMNNLIAAAQATGLKISADVSRMHGEYDPSEGYEQWLPMCQELAKAFPNDDTVVSWTFADEPGPSGLSVYGAPVRAIREADPLHRPELIVFNAPQSFMPYAPYLQVSYWDEYPNYTNEPSHNPWQVRATARAYRQIAPGKPFWAVLQAFSSWPSAKGYSRTSDAETRLMAYLAVAEGAKGLIWFYGWLGHGAFEIMSTRTGNPGAGLLPTLEDLSKRLIPIGQQLLATEPADNVKVNVLQLDQPATGRRIEVSVLKHKSKPVYYLVAVNEDLAISRKAQAALPPEMQKKGYGVYDLFRLDGKNLLEGNPYGKNLLEGKLLKDPFNIDTLAGGDGRIYLVSDANTYQSQSSAINCARAMEDARVLTPDLTIAKKWGLPVSDVEAAIAACGAAAQKGDPGQARAQADIAGRLLERALENSSELNITRSMLREIASELDEVARIAEYPSQKPGWWTGGNHPMLIPNPAFLEQSKRYFMVGRGYRDLYTRYIKGGKEGLGADVFKLRMECLQMRDDILAMLRGKLETREEPPAK